MSTTYSIVCDDCKVRIWVGQNRWFYQPESVCSWLHGHVGHTLRFLNNHVEDEYYYNGESISHYTDFDEIDEAIEADNSKSSG